MSTATEVDRVAEHLYTRLTGGATLVARATGGMHEAPAPQGSTYPLVTYHLHTAKDLLAVGTARIWTRSEWIVKGVAEGESYDRTMADEIDDLLHDTVDHDSAAGVTLTIARIAPVRYSETSSGKQYRHLGGRYLIIAHTA